MRRKSTSRLEIHRDCLPTTLGTLMRYVTQTMIKMLLGIAVLFCFVPSLVASDVNPAIAKYLNNHCNDCHNPDYKEAGLDLTKLSSSLDNHETLDKWVYIFDRVKAGEMPPSESETPGKNETHQFLNELSGWLKSHLEQRNKTQGRVQGRRLTNLQLERTLHDLLGIDVPLAIHMTDDSDGPGFNTVASGQAMSHFQLEKHLEVVDMALDEAFGRVFEPTNRFDRLMPARQIARTNPRRRCREPEMRNDLAVVWSHGLMFYGRVPATTAREDGWYRFTIRAKALKIPEHLNGIWCTVRRGRCVSSSPLMAWVGAFEATDEMQEWTFETWLPAGEMIEIRPGDTTLKKARTAGGQVGAGEIEPQNVPGIAMESIRVERIHHGPGEKAIQEFLFGDLQWSSWKSKGKQKTVLKSQQPKRDLERLMTAFATRAYRRPVEKHEIADYISLAHDFLAEGYPLLDALRAGYRALLCSPRFLYFEESVGELDDYAIASRLSYFLWGTMPDQELFTDAKSGALKDHVKLEQQVDRMLAHPYGKRFIVDFADQWLQLNMIDFTEPDRRMFPTFDLVVQQSMLEESQMYLQDMLENDRSVKQFIDSDHTFLNSRLARFYRLPNVKGDQLQRTSFPEETPRGGLITQGAILKVTANGTQTSPVVRGVWLNERILGISIPEPPKAPPAIEPDIRGATTIRDMLEKHRSIESCSSCHRKIDPPGFALEQFDPAGQFRTHYPRLQKRRFVNGNKIDPAYTLHNGKNFDDLNGFRSVVCEDLKPIAENLVEEFLTYGTGAIVDFRDRDVVEKIAASAKGSNYGFRSLLYATVTSSIFLSK